MSGAFWIILGFFAFVMALVTAAGYLFLLRPAARAESRAGLLSAQGGASAGGVLAQAFRRVGETVPSSAGKSRALRKLLVAAGYRSPAAVPLLYGVKCAGSLFLALITAWGAFQAQDSISAAFLPALCAGALGYLLPDRVLRSMIQARRGRIRRSLPDALDLLVLCVEAGQSLDQALVDASAELRHAYPDLSAELAVASLELRAGASRPEALRNLAERNGEPELRKLVNLLIQSDRFGTSLGPALRVHARYLRIRAKQQAEEAARKISIKLLFPIFFLIFPCMLMVTAGPAVLQIFTQLLPMISGNAP
jgi:tight adherence protein C